MIGHARYFLSVAVVSLIWVITGCATFYTPAACTSLDPEQYIETHDPFESVNRAVFNFNLKSDKAIYQPIARAYKKFTPDPVESSVSSFYRNLKEPRNMISSLLSGRLGITAQSGVRFTMNTTFGLFGIFDVADMTGIPYKDHDFGHMFGYWGFGDGPYIVWPFAGPSNLRDSVGSATHMHFTYVEKRIKKSENQLFVQFVSVIDTRARLLPLTDLLEQQPDAYLFARESYRQSRLNTICNP